jgi:pantothenate kinase
MTIKQSTYVQIFFLGVGSMIKSQYLAETTILGFGGGTYKFYNFLGRNIKLEQINLFRHHENTPLNMLNLI